ISEFFENVRIWSEIQLTKGQKKTQQAGGRMWCSAGPGVEPAGGWMWSTTSAPSGRGGARTGPGQEAHVARVSRCAGVSELGPWRPASSKVLFLRGKEGPWRHGGQPSSSSVTSSSAGRSSLCQVVSHGQRSLSGLRRQKIRTE
uniref:Uncharacterized protein n=1 Tax=Aegilops tauschii subsp. strangulata TaxID=200361 RepID=A0A452Y5N8_AEGTS